MMLQIELTTDQIELLEYCLEQQAYEFDEVEQREYQKILNAFKYASPV
jgi:hypothetical protein